MKKQPAQPSFEDFLTEGPSVVPEFLVEKPGAPVMTWERLGLSRPQMLTGLVAGSLVVFSLLGIGAGYGWLWMQSSEESQAVAAEHESIAPAGQKPPISTPIHEADTVEAEFDRLFKIAQTSSEQVRSENRPDGPLLMLAMDNSAFGGSDPFAPLVRPVDDSAAGVGLQPGPGEEPDPLDEVEYTGFIGDVKDKDKVAIIKVGGSTLIKKPGDSFEALGERVILKEVATGRIRVIVKGESRIIPLRPYSDGQTTSAVPAGASTASGATAGTPTVSLSPLPDPSTDLQEL